MATESTPLLDEPTTQVEYVKPTRKVAHVTSSFKYASCCLFILLFIWIIGLLIWFYLVHLQIVFLNPPNVNYGGETYYLKIGATNAALANIGSFAWWVYYTDFFLILPPFFVPSTLFLAENYNSNVLIILVTIFLILLAIWEFVKVCYFTYYIFNVNCAKYPFCVPRSGTSTSPADGSYVIEYALSITYMVFSIAVAILLPVIFNIGYRDRALLFETTSSRMSGREKQKPAHKFNLEDSRNSVIVAESIEDEESGRRGKKGKVRQRINAAATLSMNTLPLSSAETAAAPPPPKGLPGVIRQI